MMEALNGAMQLASASTTATNITHAAGFGDVERFRAAMMSAQPAAPMATLQAPAVAPTAADQSPVAIAPAAAAPMPDFTVMAPTPRSGNTLGDTILNAMNDLSADTKQRFSQVGDLLSKPNITMSDMMSVQFTLLQTSLQFEIASKGVTKVTQNVESLLKVQ